MTPDQRAAALRLARYVEVGAVQAPTGAEIAALLRELAAEPVQEPVGWAVFVGDEHLKTFETEDNAVRWYRQEYAYGSPYDYRVRPLYASPQPQQTEPSQDTPPQSQPLNFDQLQRVMQQHFGAQELTDDEADSAEAFARAVERAHGIGEKP